MIFLSSLKNDLGDIFKQSDEDLQLIFTLNIITVRVYEEYTKNFGIEEPSIGKIKYILNRTNLDSPTKDIIIERLVYWLSKQDSLDWNNQLGIKRSRTFPNLKIMDGDGNICSWPGCDSRTNLEKDHKFPYSLGGDSDLNNLQLLCAKCNLAKGNSVYSINTWPEE